MAQQVKQQPRSQRQPTRPGAQREPREFDQTQLRAACYGHRVHRDYAAHFFRWGFARRFVTSRSVVLDVGCGQDGALVSVLSQNLSSVPRRYVGVDLNSLPRVPRRSWATYHEKFNFVARWGELGDQFTVVTCFEMIEHMAKPNGLRLLRSLRACCAPAGTVLLSTPVFNGTAAKNHVHEWRVPELSSAVHAAGLRVADRFGTFASQRDVKPDLDAHEVSVLERLSKYYDNDVLSCFVAPLHPDHARNCIWILKRDDAPQDQLPLNATKRVAAAVTKRAPIVAPTKATEAVKVTAARPDAAPRLGSGRYMRQRLAAGADHATVLAEVREKFPQSRATLHDVAWNQRRLRLRGVE